MSNILNHNRKLIDFVLTNEDYWDFQLSENMGYGKESHGLSTDCLSAYIDFNDPECIEWDDIFSKGEFIWENAVNDGVDLDYIGVTGVDNGFITYKKDRITNKEFLNIFLRSSFNTIDGDKRLRLRKVNGNNQIYDYSCDIVNIDNMDVLKLNGGFYQGFFKIYGKNYQTLPYKIEDGWSFEVTLKSSNIRNENPTINDTHKDNKGIFLYVGTRAENKWWEKYSVDNDFEKSNNSYSSDGYVTDGYTSEGNDINSDYLQEDSPCDGYDDEIKKTKFIDKGYVDDEYYMETPKNCTEYVDEDYTGNEYISNGDGNCNQYVENEYLEREEPITGDEKLTTSEGYDFGQPNIIEYDTDNKFLLFDRTKDGFTTKNWKEGTKVTMYDIKKPDIGNYFTLFNRTKSGLTTKTIDDIIEKNNKHYDVLKDLYRNALAFQIKDDGSIGFKYLIKDCNDENESKYKIEKLFTKSGVIKNDEWYTISVKIVPTRSHEIDNPICDKLTTSSLDEMVIYIYVNGKLRLKSGRIPMLNLKALDDLSDKQQGVPFSLSLGGGTQGLCDVININYREFPKYVLPLEKEFCGSFVGYIQDFRFYSCPLNFSEIQENCEYSKNNRQ